MGRTSKVRTLIRELKEKSRSIERSKNEYSNYLQRLKENYSQGKISYSRYVETLHKKTDGRNIQEWASYLDKYDRDCKKQIKKLEVKKAVRNVAALIFSFAFIGFLFILFSSSNINFSFTGFTIQGQSQESLQKLNLEFTESGNYEWQINEMGKLSSVKLSGSAEGNGTARVYLGELLVFEYSGEKNLEEVLQNGTSPSQEESLLSSVKNFTDSCNETCDLSELNFNKSSYTLRIEISDTKLKLNEIKYKITPEIDKEVVENENTAEIPKNETIQETPENKTDIPSVENKTNSEVPQQNISTETIENITSSEEISTEANATIQTIQYPAVLGKPVKWKKQISPKDLGKLTINLPKEAEHIQVSEIDEQTQTSSPITGGVISNGKSSNFFSRIFQFFQARLTGHAVQEQENNEIEVNLTVDKITDYEIEYETPAPYAIEEETEKGKEITIVGPDTIHYENVLSFTNLNEKLKIKNPSLVKIYWVEENSFVPVEKIEDTNNNGIYDYVEWVAPHLSNQTFQIIIEISKAAHLDENKNLISDIYEQVVALDGVWSGEIPGKDYVRITFKKNLTSGNDITLFPKVVSGNPKIEVYEKDKSEVIAEFNPITDNDYNKIYLTNLQNSQDTFDLKIVGGSLKLDYIVDPSSLYNFATCTPETNCWAQDWEVDVFPFGGTAANRNLVVSAITANYTLASSLNNLNYTTGNPGTGDEVVLFMNWTLSESVASISVINFTFCGATSSTTATNFGIYLLKANSNWITDTSWVQVGTNESIAMTKTCFTRNLSSDFSTYINGNSQIVWIVTEVLSAVNMRIDYVEMNVTTSPLDPYPTFNSYWDNNASQVGTGIGYFNTTVNSTNGTVLLNFAGTNYTATNKSGDATRFNVTIPSISAGTYPYNWTSYGNGTSAKYNVSNHKYYTVNDTPPDISITFPLNNSVYANGILDINYTRSDSVALGTCWYSNDTYAKNTTLAGCVNITGGDTKDTTATMTARGAPAPNAVWGSKEYGASQGWNAFDGINNYPEAWYAYNVLKSNLTYDFGAGNARIIDMYNFTAGHVPQPGIYLPTAWTFEGSNDNSTWTVLDSETGQSLTTNVWVDYSFTNTNPYRYYKFSVTAVSSDYVLIREMELYQSNTSVLWSEGNHNVTIWANDSVGNVNSSRVTFNISVGGDSINPNINIASPLNNTNISDNTLDILYTRSDAGGLSSCWYSNDTYAGNTTLTTGCTNITNVIWSEGNHNVTIWANDTTNNVNYSRISFTIDTIKPNINITSPLNNSNLTDNTYDINYTVSDTNLASCWYSNDTMAVNISLAPSVIKYSGNPIFNTSVAWEGTIIGESSLLHEDGVFHMWYRGNSGTSSRIGYANSTDGITWTKYGSNPLDIPLNGSTAIYFPYVIKVDSVYYLFAVKFPGDDLYRWNSTNGINWSDNNGAKPILNHTTTQGWESTSIANPAVYYDASLPDPWQMLYEATGTGFQIGYANSTNGINWTKYSGNPVLPKVASSWKSSATGNPYLTKIGDTYYAWYGGTDATGWEIGWSKSVGNMTNWTDGPRNPEIDAVLPWEGTDDADPDIVYNITGETYETYLFYLGGQNRTGLAYIQGLTFQEYMQDTTLPTCVNITNILWGPGNHNVTIWANDSAGNVNSSRISFNISGAGGGVNPVIIRVWNETLTGAIVDPTENGITGGVNDIPFTVTVSDIDGVSDINDSSVFASFNTSDTRRTNLTACAKISGDSNTTSQNYTCTVRMFYFDNNETWTIQVNASDKVNQSIISNTEKVFNYGILKAFIINPALVTWNSLNPGNTNLTSRQNTTLNNTGNVIINAGNIQISSINLKGMSDGTKYLNVNNISSSWDSSVGMCGNNTNGILLVNATYVSIPIANLTRGNVSLGTGIGQEILYYCIPRVPSLISSQTYATNNSGTWTIRILLTLLIPRKKKRKEIGNDKLLNAFNLIADELKEEYSLNKVELLEIIIEKLKDRYKISKREVLELVKSEEELEIPTAIFSKELGCLEAISKYMKENLNMSYREIAKEIGRNERTIWTSYKKAKEKDKELFQIKTRGLFLPISIFRNNKLTILESVIFYLKGKGMNYSKIAEILNRDQRNIWTTYSRLLKKMNQK